MNNEPKLTAPEIDEGLAVCERTPPERRGPSLPNHPAAVRAALAYHETGGESSLPQDITCEYRPLEKAARNALGNCLDPDAFVLIHRDDISMLRKTLKEVCGE